MNSFESFKKSPIRCIKYKNYFDVYDNVLLDFVGKQITVVEIGVAAGGSLHMWRDFFGKKARIIGIDFNPEAKLLEKDGYEIFIGNQGDVNFWKNFYSSVGNIDILIDDGGHTYIQQIITIESSLNFINDGGVILTEDTHSSYLPDFGYKKFSLIEYSKKMIDKINARYPDIQNDALNDNIWSIEFFQSFVIFKINRKNIGKSGEFIENNDNKYHDATDFRYKDISLRFKFIKTLIINLKTYLSLRKYF